jgi:hypothetical protein
MKLLKTFLYWLTAGGLAVFLLFGCKAKQIDWANECSNRYPIKEKIVKGETIYYTDTIIEPGLIIQADPILLKVKCPDSKTITKTITRTDTIIKENTAKLKALERDYNTIYIQLSKEQEKRLTAEETAQKSNRQRNAAAGIALAFIIIAFRKQIIGLVKLFLV